MNAHTTAFILCEGQCGELLPSCLFTTADVFTDIHHPYRVNTSLRLGKAKNSLFKPPQTVRKQPQFSPKMRHPFYTMWCTFS